VAAIGVGGIGSNGRVGKTAKGGGNAGNWRVLHPGKARGGGDFKSVVEEKDGFVIEERRAAMGARIIAIFVGWDIGISSG